MAKPANELTPMQRQYHAIKEQNQNCILFFSIGNYKKKNENKTHFSFYWYEVQARSRHLS